MGQHPLTWILLHGTRAPWQDMGFMFTGATAWHAWCTRSDGIVQGFSGVCCGGGVCCNHGPPSAWTCSYPPPPSPPLPPSTPTSPPPAPDYNVTRALRRGIHFSRPSFLFKQAESFWPGHQPRTIWYFFSRPRVGLSSKASTCTTKYLKSAVNVCLATTRRVSRVT